MFSTSIQFKPPLLAHRGASAYAPENTFASFKKAKELGVAWIEFDVMLAACGEVVVFHDESLERTTNGRGKVCEQPYSYLKTLDAGSWFDPSFAGERIPTLKELLLFLEQYPLAANIELKALPGNEAQTVEKVLAEVGRAWPKTLPPPLFSSFSLETLKVLRARAPSACLGLLIHSWFPEWEKVAEDLQCSSFNLNQELLNLKSIETLKAKGLPLLAYTVNDPLRASNLFSWGVDALFTDCPDRLLKVLRKP